MRLSASLALAIATFALAACEDHPKRVARGAPEYLHEALTGDVGAQARLAECLEAGGKCFDTPPDPPMACAWRGVRLASRTPVLSLADTEAYAAACSPGGPTFRQRAALAQDDFTRRLHRRPAPTAPPPRDGLLYPSAETVRQRINAELRAASQPALPPFGPVEMPGDQARLAWKSCASSVCLQGAAPEFGGGLYGYRVVVTGPPNRARPLAVRLAVAGLETPSVADALAALPEGRKGLVAGPVCWTIGRIGSDAVFAGASLGAC